MTAAPGLLDAPLDPELLRGVPLKVCLQGIGKHWKRSIAASDSSSLTVENSYGLSQKTDRIDFFFSHDWETSRLLKWLSLLVMFNSHAAATAMMLVTTCLVVLAAMGGLPMVLWPWPPVFSMLSYAVMFLFWQRFRSFCGKPLLVFLDRLCIAQHDMALKEQGIRGLGSFLEKSQNLTILWSGRYFSRLWCLYEVASYLKDERSEHKNIQILPVHLCLLLCIASAQATSWMFAIHLAVGTMGVDGWWIIENPVLFNLFGRGGAAFIPVALYVGLGCMTRLYQLPRQLQNFRVQDAQCFCCSNGHQHPETGKELPCDRRLVFSALEKWFSRDDDVDGDWMERFNRMVREKLSSRIAHTVGRGLPPFKYVLSTVCLAPVPYIGFFIVVSFMGLEDEEIDGHDLDKEDDMVFFVLAELMEFLLPSLYGVFCLLLIIQVCRLVFYFFQKLGISTSVLAHPCRRALLALLISPMLWAVLVFGIWVPMIGEFSDGGELLPEVKGILYLLYCAVVGAFFFLPELDCSQPGVSTNGGTWRDPGTILGSGEIPSISGTALKPGVDSAMGEDLCREIEEELMSVRF